jgi:phi13 family phage major tail protein
MALIGCKYPVFAPGTYVDGEMPTYKGSVVLGKLISAELSINNNDNPLYGDDSIVENDKTFSDGTITIGIDDLGETWQDACKVAGLLTGATVSEQEGTYQFTSGGNDIAPYGGVGYYKRGIKNNTAFYEVTWIYKVQFGTMGDSASTKEKSISWNTKEIEGTIFVLDGVGNNTYRDTWRFATESEAQAKINELAGISEGV